MRIPPLRLLLPGALLLSTLIFIPLVMVPQDAIARARIQAHGRATLQEHLARLDEELAGGLMVLDQRMVRSWMASITLDPAIATLLLVDDRQNVLLSNRYEQVGQPAAAVSAFDAVVAAATATGAAGRIIAAPDQERVCGYYAFPIATAPGELRPQRRGILYGEYALARELALSRVDLWNNAFRLGALVLLLTLGLAIALHVLVSRRVQRLIATMRRIADGDLASRCRITGDDEIAQLAQAFDTMAERLERERQALDQSRLRYQQLVEGTEDLVTIVDGDGRFAFVNAVAEHIYGMKPGACVGQDIVAFIHPDDREQTRRWLQEVTAQRKERSSIENRQVHRDGRVSTMLWNCHFHYHDDGRCHEIDGIARDITNRIAADAALRTANSRMEALFHGARDAIILADPATGLIIEVNRQAEALIGRPRSALVGTHHSTLHPADLLDSLQAAFHQHATGMDAVVTTEVLRLDGTRIPVEINSSIVTMPDGRTVLLGIFRDIRDRLRLEERLRQSEKLSVIGQLAGGVAHDFNNQLAGIIGFAEMLTKRLDDGRLRQYADNILRAALRSSDLTRQLLAFSRKGKYLNTPVDVHLLIHEVVALLHRSLDRRITIRQRLEASPPTTLGDPTQLQNALLNLAVNARDAMPTGGELVFATAVTGHPGPTVALEPPTGRFLRLVVGDTGTGMDAETRAHLFEPFFTTKPQGRGTGLGLAAVYGTVTNHHGAIQVASAPGEGTTCTIWLPLHEEAPPATATATGARATAERACILVIDDEPVMRSMLAEMLQAAGHQVVCCADGETAIVHYREAWSRTGLVILDMIMPRLGGGDTFRALRRIHPAARILLVSGYSLDAEAQALLDEGALGFIEKPCPGHTILALVDQALAPRPGDAQPPG